MFHSGMVQVTLIQTSFQTPAYDKIKHNKAEFDMQKQTALTVTLLSGCGQNFHFSEGHLFL